ncbi:hypothetical protein LOTGIDRAFT_174502 [Lottia gigantea]|uniref:Apple domain-containing protein n=1 Tax=Lottia gigantea TaxID=225164 RepID=V4A085_LOTGI|nr:hypothetical protein LOTGIDRAFT_174502 [Lottia gigantea]ESO97218.1 hypothetical protein LOTGIDRAFT_174502 [Lottia gigantea]
MISQFLHKELPSQSFVTLGRCSMEYIGDGQIIGPEEGVMQNADSRSECLEICLEDVDKTKQCFAVEYSLEWGCKTFSTSNITNFLTGVQSSKTRDQLTGMYQKICFEGAIKREETTVIQRDSSGTPLKNCTDYLPLQESGTTTPDPVSDSVHLQSDWTTADLTSILFKDATTYSSAAMTSSPFQDATTSLSFILLPTSLEDANTSPSVILLSTSLQDANTSQSTALTSTPFQDANTSPSTAMTAVLSGTKGVMSSKTSEETSFSTLESTVPVNQDSTAVLNLTDLSTASNSTVGQSEMTASYNGSTQLYCACTCEVVLMENIDDEVQKTRQKLRILRTKTSAARRAKTSAEDDRPSSKAIGSFGIIVLASVLTLIMFGDITRVIQCFSSEYSSRR